MENFIKSARADGSIDKLDPEQRLYLERVNEGFLEAGINQSEENKARIKQLSKDIARIGKEARTNIDEDQTAIEVKEDELENL